MSAGLAIIITLLTLWIAWRERHIDKLFTSHQDQLTGLNRRLDAIMSVVERHHHLIYSWQQEDKRDDERNNPQ